VLRIFKQNDISSVFAIVIFTFLLKAKYMLHPPGLNELDNFQHGMLFSFPQLASLYNAHPSFYVFLSVCLLLCFSMYFNVVVTREKFLQGKSYLPALSFLILSSFAPVLNIFSTATIASLILFIAFSKTMQLYQTTNPRKVCFDIGILVSVAALFYFPSILFVFLFLALLLLLRPFSLEENMAYFLGVLTPVYLSLALIYLSGHWYDLHTIVFLNLTPPIKTMALIPLVMLTVVSTSMLVYGLYLVNQAGIKNAISVRKKWNGVVLYLFFACVIGIFSNVFPGVPWILTMAPISIILSQTFLNNKEKYNTFTFYFLIIVVILVQWVL
jgi:hypothetical protein